MKLPEVVGCLHPRHAKSLDLRLSTLEPLNSGIMQIRVCKIGPVIFEYENIRVYLSIISECHLFMKAPGADMSSAARRGSANGASSGSAGTGPRTAQRGGRGVFQQLCCPKEATFRAEDAGEAAMVRDNSRSNLM